MSNEKRIYEDGSSLDGYLKNDMHHGLGIYTTSEGDAYYAVWEDGWLKEMTKIVFASGDVYKGEFYEAMPGASIRREGQGKQRYASGDIYEGEWRADKRHGKGKIIYANGDIFEGNWEFDEIAVEF